MRKRTTVNIAVILAEINKKNMLSTCAAEVRQGWNSLLESILMAANVYRGFGYLRASDVPKDAKPGIAFRSRTGRDLTARQFDIRRDDPEVTDETYFPDESRRVYYIDHALTAAYRDVVASEDLPRQRPITAQDSGASGR